MNVLQLIDTVDSKLV